MRPLLLEFQAFGSYPGREVVDFGPLSQRGLFVVTGPTGTGKTTIFDAMVFALYGRLPGARSSGGRERSDHAEPGVETVVTLDFEVSGTHYRVRRTPGQERQAKRGGGTTQQAAAANLMRVDGAGTESLATGVSNVNKECQRLIGLGPAEFQKVVLLPQGEFSKFLIASDADREALLKELFTGDFYSDVTQWLKARMLELGQQVEKVEEEIRHHRRNVDEAMSMVLGEWFGRPGVPEMTSDDVAALSEAEIDRLLADLQPVVVSIMADKAEAEAAAHELTTRLATVDAEALRFDSAQLARQGLEELAERAPAVESAAVAAEQSRRARPVIDAQSTLDSATQGHETTLTDERTLQESVSGAFSELGLEVPEFAAGPVAAAVTSAKGDLVNDLQLLKATTEAEAKVVAAESAVTTATDTLDKAIAAAAEVEASIAQSRERIAELEPLAAGVVAASALVDSSRRTLALLSDLEQRHADRPGASSAADAARGEYEQTMSRFVTSQAPLLARSLLEGEPCAVCGSVEHPAPAVLGDGEMVDNDMVLAAQEVADRTRDALRSIDDAIRQIVAELNDDASASSAEWRVRVESAEASLEAARSAEAALVAARSTLDVQLTAQKAAQEGLVEANGVAATATGAAETARVEAERLRGLSASIDADRVAQRAAGLDVLSGLSAQIAEVVERRNSAATALDIARRTLESALSSSGFAAVAEAAAVVVTVEAEEQALAARETARLDREKLTASLATLQEQGIPEVRPDTTDLREQQRSAQDRAGSIAALASRGSDALSRAEEHLGDARDVAAGSSELRERHATARRVFQACNGESPRLRVKLERWVLAHELDRVTQQANVHLERMTNRRYRLQRAIDGGRGLTLEVLDAHVGRQRPTATLSGGEQFQASLALALGLADVISHGGAASGKQFEALFVDEGYGSLDPAALDQAIDALTQIQASGRMVGAITHVEGMKERLHVGIEVSRRPGDSGSTLTVHP